MTCVSRKAGSSTGQQEGSGHSDRDCWWYRQSRGRPRSGECWFSALVNLWGLKCKWNLLLAIKHYIDSKPFPPHKSLWMPLKIWEFENIMKYGTFVITIPCRKNVIAFFSRKLTYRYAPCLQEWKRKVLIPFWLGLVQSKNNVNLTRPAKLQKSGNSFRQYFQGPLFLCRIQMI